MAEKALQKVEADLNCLVCLDTYTDPTLLQCHHTFCKGCLRRLVDRNQQGQLALTCPTCRKVTPVPARGVAGLQPAFHINHLLEILKEHKKTTGNAHYCPEHPTRELESFCETCEKLICLECAIEQHQSHKCNLVSKLFKKYKREIVSSLKPVEDRLTVARKARNDLHIRHREISDQQDSLEANICEHARQIQEAAETKKVELINKLHHITGEKLQDLDSQRAEMETTIAQLSSYLDTVRKSLETSSHGEVVKMKTTVGQQTKELANAFQPDLQNLNIEADMVFTTNCESLEVCRAFGDVCASRPPDPAQCHVTGTAPEEAIVGEKSTATMQAMDSKNRPCKMQLPSLECELVSESTGTKERGLVERTGESQYEISYQPIVKGRHQLHIKISDQHIRGSPFSVAVQEPLPKGWEARKAANGRVIYIDNNTRQTQWSRPTCSTEKGAKEEEKRNKWKKKSAKPEVELVNAAVEEPLPKGWEEKHAASGEAFYIDHNTRRTQWNRPTCSAEKGAKEEVKRNKRMKKGAKPEVDPVNNG